jgi:hypothetical protein
MHYEYRCVGIVIVFTVFLNSDPTLSNETDTQKVIATVKMYTLILWRRLYYIYIIQWDTRTTAFCRVNFWNS